MASFCVERFGTERIVNLNNDELKNRISEFKHLVKFDL
jgi:hypothetical protein